MRSSGPPAGRRVWQDEPDEYAHRLSGRLSQRQWRSGRRRQLRPQWRERSPARAAASSGSTGEDLRQSAGCGACRAALPSEPAARKRPEGDGAWQDRPRNAPPVESYFISYADRAARRRGARTHGRHRHPSELARRRPACRRPRAANSRKPDTRRLAPRGSPALPASVHLGRLMAPPGAPPGKPPGPPLQPPPGRPTRPAPASTRLMRSRTGAPKSAPAPASRAARDPTSRSAADAAVRSATLAANAACSNSSCPAGETTIGPSNFCCKASKVYTGAGGAQACCSGPLVNGRCLPAKRRDCPPGGPPNAGCPVSPTGYVPAGGSCCLASQVDLDGRFAVRRTKRRAARPGGVQCRSSISRSDRSAAPPA